MIAVPLLAGGNDETQVTSSADPTTSSSERDQAPTAGCDGISVPEDVDPADLPACGEATTTTIPEAVDPAGGPDTVVTSPPQTTSSTTQRCRDSYDESCGGFYWDPPPGPNRPATVAIAMEQDGANVHFTVTWHDPDSPVRPICPSAEFGDGTYSDIPCAEMACAEHPPGFGAWTPPDPEPGTHTWELDHTYEADGSYTFAFRGEAEECGPYGSDADGSKVVAIVG